MWSEGIPYGRIVVDEAFGAKRCKWGFVEIEGLL